MRKSTPSARERGRPSLFSDDLAAAICRRLADGESLRDICEDAAMPSRETVRSWLRSDPDFRVQYDIARVDQADALADEAMHAVRSAKDAGEAAVARVNLDAILWRTSKLAPKTYGDKIETTTTHTLVDANGEPRSVLEIARRVGFLLAAGAHALNEGER